MEDNVRLTDYLMVIYKKKWFILGTVLSFMVIFGSINLLSQKVYRVLSAIDIGRINGSLIESPADLVNKIGKEYRFKAIRESSISEREYQKIRTEQQGKKRVLFSIDIADTKRAMTILEELNRLIIEDHNKQADMWEKEVKALIKIGSYFDGELIEEPAGVAERIKEIYPLLLPEMTEISEIGAKPLGPSYIAIIAKTEDALRGVRVLKEISRLLIEEHEEEITNKKDQKIINLELLKAKKEKIHNSLMLTARRRKTAQQEIKKIEEQLDHLFNQVISTKSSNVNIEAENVGIELGTIEILRSIQRNQELLRRIERNLEENIPEVKEEIELENIDRKIFILESIINNFRDTRVVVEPSVVKQNIIPSTIVFKPIAYGSPVKPGKLYISILLGGTLGLVGGVFLAFFIEFISTVITKGKEKIS